MMTAVTPPMKSDTGFLNTRHETESGDTSAASPAGREKSMQDRLPGCSRARVAASKLFCNGQGRIIGVGTVSVVSKTLRGVVLPSEKILRALNLRVVYLSK
jgi:hypothetical protein